MIDDVARRWRDALIETIKPQLGSALFLSGGMDSRTLLAARASLGDVPHCYTFSVGGRETQELDASRQAARYVGAQLSEVVIPADLERLVADVRESIQILRRSGKAAIQCSQPVLYMARTALADGHSCVMVGTGGICEDNRKCQVAAHAGDWELVDRIRRENIDSSGNPRTTTWAMLETVRSTGLLVAEPYATDPLRSVGLAVSYSEINSPRQKGIGLRAFPDFYTAVPWRLNSSLQVGSGLREFHDQLLDSPYNKRGSVAVIGVYNDLAKEVL